MCVCVGGGGSQRLHVCECVGGRVVGRMLRSIFWRLFVSDSHVSRLDV